MGITSFTVSEAIAIGIITWGLVLWLTHLMRG